MSTPQEPTVAPVESPESQLHFLVTKTEQEQLTAMMDTANMDKFQGDTSLILNMFAALFNRVTGAPEIIAASPEGAGDPSYDIILTKTEQEQLTAIMNAVRLGRFQGTTSAVLNMYAALFNKITGATPYVPPSASDAQTTAASAAVGTPLRPSHLRALTPPPGTPEA